MQKKIFCTQTVSTRLKCCHASKHVELCIIRSFMAKTSNSPCLNAFLRKNNVTCAKTRCCVLKRVFCTIFVLTRWKRCHASKHVEPCRISLVNIKTSESLDSNALFRGNNVRCSKTRYCVLKKRFLHTNCFNITEGLPRMQTS